MRLSFRAAAEVAVLVVLTLLSAVFVAGELSHSAYSPVRIQPISQGIHADGWVEDGAVIRLSGLASRGNFIDIAWDPWRPDGAGPAKFNVSVCGETASSFDVASAEPTRVYLRGSCEPRIVELSVLNPFTHNGTDGRPLGAKITRVQIGSRFGVPLMDNERLAEVFGALLILSFGAWLLLRHDRRLRILGSLAVLGVTVGLVATTTVAPDKIYPLWLFFAALMGGLVLASLHLEDDEATSSFDLTKTVAIPGIMLVVALGMYLRISGLAFGLPATFHPDEVPKVNAIMRMVDNHDFNPRYFLHPSLLLYCTYGVNTLLHAFGIEGNFRDTAFFAGRIVSCTAGILSIPLVYSLGVLLFNRMVGLGGALLLAVFPLHVTCSRYLKEDALLTFTILLTVWLVVYAVRRDRPWLLLLAGLTSGLTAGSKYSGLLIGGVVFAAPWYASRSWVPSKKYLTWALLAAPFMPLGFLLSTPYSVLDYPTFIKDFRSESRHMQTGHTTAIDPWSQLWMYHFARSVLPGMGDVIALLSVGALGYLAWKRRLEGLILVGMVLLFYLPAEYVKAKPAPQPERYILPCLPFMALALAAAFNQLVPRRVPATAFAAVGALALLPLVRSAQLANEVKNDTRDRMAAWMLANIPPGSKVLMDWRPYNPYLEGGPFEIVYVPRARILMDLDVRALKASGGQYLVLSSLFYDRYLSQPEVNPLLRQRIREVFERVPIVLQMKPEHGTYGFHNPTLTLFSLAPQDFAKLEGELKDRRAGKLEATSNEMKARVRW